MPLLRQSDSSTTGKGLGRGQGGVFAVGAALLGDEVEVLGVDHEAIDLLP